MSNLENANKKKAVIYCRVSTKEQVDEGNSLATQEKICREYAVKEGYEIDETFIEQGESAKTSNRTELQKLLSFCSNKKSGIKAVIIYKLDRLSRNTDDYSQLRIIFKKYGVEIKSVTEFFENTPAGKFLENIISNVSQFDNDVRTERSVNGMKEAVKDGRYVWTAPIGYSNVRVGGKATIAPNEMSHLVRKAFEMVAEGICPIKETYRQITEKGLVNRKGKPLALSQFYVMLTTHLYCGWITTFGERNRGLFEPIISEALFNKAQMVLKQKARKNTHYITINPDFCLRRFVTHPEGTALTGSWSKGRGDKHYAYYRFGMKGGNFQKNKIELVFRDFQNKYAIDREMCNKLNKCIRKELKIATSREQKEMERLKNFIAELSEKQNILIQKNMNGVINDQILKAQLDIIEKQRLEVEYTIENSLLDKDYDYASVSFSEEYLTNPGRVWLKAEPEEKIKLQWFHFPFGVTFDGKTFGTTKTSLIFKLKDTFSSHHSIRVPSDLNFWKQVVEEYKQLENIFKKDSTN